MSAQAGDPETLVRRLMEVWETGNGEQIAEIATPAIVYDDVPNGERFVGIEGARRYVEHVHAWAAQVEIAICAIHTGPQSAVAEWTMRGVHDRPIPNRVPVATHRRFELKGATVVEVRDGRIARAADYLDVLGFVLQLGGRVELPGGVVIPPDPAAAPDAGAADGPSAPR